MPREVDRGLHQKPFISDNTNVTDLDQFPINNSRTYHISTDATTSFEFVYSLSSYNGAHGPHGV